MQIELDVMARAKRAYERGRMRGAFLRALSLCAGAAALAALLQEGEPWAKLPLTFAIWFAVYYWGRALLRGARLGLIAGFATSLVPLSWLRPCCKPGMMATSGAVCTMPGMCVLTGALIGLALASSMPRGLHGRARLECALGMSIGALSLVWLKCSLLFWGEALGLIGGLLAGIAVVGVGALRPLRA